MSQVNPDPLCYPSHGGKMIAVTAMAAPHIERALAKLQDQEGRLVRILVGLDEQGRSDLVVWGRKENPWTPDFTAEELLERTRRWIGILKGEQDRREKERWPELHE